MGAGGGFGWKTIEQIAVELNIPIDKVMAILKEARIDAKKRMSSGTRPKRTTGDLLIW